MKQRIIATVLAGIQEAYDVEGFLLDFKGKRTSDISKVIGYRLPTEAEWEYAHLEGINPVRGIGIREAIILTK